jgi:uncharacterized protein (DUF2062 family)
MRVDWQELYKQYELYFKNFRFYDLFKVSALKIVLPLALGYILVGLVFGLSAYLIILIALKLTRGKKEERNGKDKERR